MAQCNTSHVFCISCKLASTCRGWIRLWFDHFGESVGSVVVFHPEMHDVQLFLFVLCLQPPMLMPRSVYLLGVAKWWYSNSIIPSSFICFITSIKRHFPSFTSGLPGGNVERQDQYWALAGWFCPLSPWNGRVGLPHGPSSLSSQASRAVLPPQPC